MRIASIPSIACRAPVSTSAPASFAPIFGSKSPCSNASARNDWLGSSGPKNGGVTQHITVVNNSANTR